MRLIRHAVVSCGFLGGSDRYDFVYSQHLGLSKQTPMEREAANGTNANGKVAIMSRPGGLHPRYDLAG